MTRTVHTFENGVSVYDDHLIWSQRERYAKRNVHEPEEEELFVRVIRGLPARACYVNIGSAVGYYALLAKKLAPDLLIHAVEPLQRHRDFFTENIHLNGFAVSDFTIHPEAVGAIDGAVSFLAADYSSSIYDQESVNFRPLLKRLWSTIAPSDLTRSNASPVVETVIVKAITLDSLTAKIGGDVDLLQMDVQGSELDVLRGGGDTLRRTRLKRLLIGTHGKKIHGDCVSYLRSYDYSIQFDRYQSEGQPDGILLATKI